jgi:hypothetical protein
MTEPTQDAVARIPIDEGMRQLINDARALYEFAISGAGAERPDRLSRETCAALTQVIYRGEQVIYRGEARPQVS